jgi:calcium-dependent protein kinase
LADFSVVRPHSQLFSKICKESIDFSNLSNEGVSAAAQEFLQLLLQKNRRQRPTATEALCHPWMQDPGNGGVAPDTPLQGTAVQRLQRFAVNSHLKQHVLTMMANDMLAEGADITQRQCAILSDLRELFTLADTDLSGDVSVVEMTVRRPPATEWAD